MSSSRYDKVWNILTKYDFDVSKNEGEVTCGICSRIMVNPFTTYCGCHYCCSCIKNVLTEGNKYCPRKKEECFEEILEFDKNVVKDYETNRKIMNMNVKCPFAECSFKSKLINMEEHIHVCEIMSVNCPYKTVGCSDSKIKLDNIKEHLEAEMIPHAFMVVDIINHLRNDVNDLKGLLQYKEREINELRNDNERCRRELEEVKEDRGICKMETIELKQKLSESFEIINEINLPSHKSTSLFCLNRNEGYRNNSKSFQMKNKKSIANFTSFSLGSLLEDRDRYILSNDDNVERSNGSNGSKENEEMISNIETNFEWKITDFTKKLSGILYASDFIYKCKYKLCLRINIKRILFGDHLQIFAVIMKGIYDEEIPWPLKHNISVGILNQHSMKIHKYWIRNFKTYTDKSVFNKPCTDMNNEIYCGWIYMKEIRCVKGLLLDDCILLQCSLTE